MTIQKKITAAALFAAALVMVPAAFAEDAETGKTDEQKKEMPAPQMQTITGLVGVKTNEKKTQTLLTTSDGTVYTLVTPMMRKGPEGKCPDGKAPEENMQPPADAKDMPQPPADAQAKAPDGKEPPKMVTMEELEKLAGKTIEVSGVIKEPGKGPEAANGKADKKAAKRNAKADKKAANGKAGKVFEVFSYTTK